MINEKMNVLFFVNTLNNHGIQLTKNTLEMNNNLAIPFRSYCDTFWDLNGGEDENSIQCQQWWVCETDEGRCATGHCINDRWRDDSEWDCPDAHDERLYLNAIADLVQERNPLSPILNNKSYFHSNNCKQSDAFLCLYPQQLSYPQFHCINQSQIGDGKINCAGAIDEQMTLKHCSQSSMLGPYFLCLSTNTLYFILSSLSTTFSMSQSNR